MVRDRPPVVPPSEGDPEPYPPPLPITHSLSPSHQRSYRWPPTPNLRGSGPLTKVALLVEPALLREIVSEALSLLPDVQVEEAGPLRAVREPRRTYDVIILSLTGHDDQEGWRWLARFPAARVIALHGDGADAVVYEMRPHRFPLGELSLRTLREAICTSPAARVGGGG